VNEQGSTATAPEAETQPDTATAPEAVTQPDTATAPEAVTQPDTATAPEAVTQPGPDQELNQQIAEALSQLLRSAHDLAQGIGGGLGLAASDVMALLKLEEPMTMKELGLRIGCDPSFVTSIADTLESHALARREPSQRDRRSKTIVLTPEGEKVRDRIRDELSARAPWCTTLDVGERRCLLGLMRKMLRWCEGR
jgi:MarR family transcriptional regulator, organic hydroperoxide resistance regulator